MWKRYKATLVKSFFYLLIFHFLDFGLTLLFETKAFQIFSIQNLASSDFTYNDLFYRAQEQNEQEAIKRTHKEDIFLINTASLDGDEFRLQLAEIIDSVSTFSPKTIGVDITFKNDTSKIGTTQLLNLAATKKNIVFAYSSKEKYLPLPKNVTYGDVDLPSEQHSIRFYKGGKETFAYQLFLKARGEYSRAAEWESFPILYSCIHDGLSHLEEMETDKDFSVQYHYVNADQVLENPSSIRSYVQNNIVIFGHLGSKEEDMEDKFPVPTDSTDMVNRLPVMYGPVIHANALSNMLDDHFLSVPSPWLIFILTNLVMFIMVFLIINHPVKLYLILGLVAFSVLWIGLSIYLMEYNIYIQVGATLIELLILEEFIESFDPFVEKWVTAYQYKKRKKHEKLEE
jgi:CHASE2 domain-containing sensor protein